MNNTQLINKLKLELVINETLIKQSSQDDLEQLLTQRATLKDLLIEALQEQLNIKEAA